MKYIIFLGFLLATTFAEEEPLPQEPEQAQVDRKDEIARMISEGRPLNIANEQQQQQQQQQLQMEEQQQEQQPQQLQEQQPQQQQEIKRPQRHLLLETYETPLLYQTQYLYQYPQPLLYYQPSALFPQPYVLQKLAKK